MSLYSEVYFWLFDVLYVWIFNMIKLSTFNAANGFFGLNSDRQFILEEMSLARAEAALEPRSPQREKEEDSISISPEPGSMDKLLPARGGRPFSLPQLAGMKKNLFSATLCLKRVFERARDKKIIFICEQLIHIKRRGT